MKLYWEKPYETDFSAIITKIVEKKTAEYGIVLDQSLFYPSKGGQMCDRGILRINNREYEVFDVIEENNSTFHKIKPIGTDKKSIGKDTLSIGDKVEGKIDWNFRYALMKAHTSQHIISALLKKHYGADTVHANIGPEEVSIQFSKKLSLDDLEVVLLKASELFLNENKRAEIDCFVLPQKEALDKYSDRIRGNIVDEDPIRIVKISEGNGTIIDLMCCGGIHIKSTVEIGSIFLLKFNKDKEIRYLVGDEASKVIVEANIKLIKAASASNQIMMKIDEFVQKSLVEIRTLRKSNKDLSFRLLEAFSQTSGTNFKKINIKVIEFPSDRKILNSGFKKFSPNTLLVAKINSLSIAILSSSPDVDASKLMKFFNEKFGGRGGGGPKVAQGSLKKEPEDFIPVIKEFLT